MQIGQVPGGGQSFGDIFRVNTPALDRFSQQMYVQQQQEQRQRQLDLQNLDNEFSKNMANIRDADINDYSKAYDDYKIAYQQSLKQKNPMTIEQQKDLMQKKADVYSVIRKSKETDTRLQDYSKRIGADTKGLFADDAVEQMLGLNKTPSNQIADDKYLGLLHRIGNTDFSGAYKYANGTPKKVVIDEGAVDPTDPTKNIKYNYTVGSNYLDYFGKLGEKVAGSKQQRDFRLLQNNSITPDEEQALTIKFNQVVNDPLYKKLYGIDGKDYDFPKYAYEPDSLANAMRIATMQNVVSNPPTGSPEKYTNQTNLMAARDKIADENSAVKFTRDKILRAMSADERRDYFDYTQVQQTGIMNNKIDEDVDKQVATAKDILAKNKGNFYAEPAYLPVDPSTLKAFNVDNFQLSEDGTKIIPIWHEKTGTDTKTGADIIEERQGTPMTIDGYKSAIGKRNIGAKYFQKQSAPAQQTTTKTGSKTKEQSYTNITETNKGTIGVKNGKWYDIKTGKPIE